MQSDNEDVVRYDHKRVRAALDAAYRKYPPMERYPRMLDGVREMLRRAMEYGGTDAIEYQRSCLKALLADGC